MRKLLAIMLVAGFFTACDSNSTSSNKDSSDTTTPITRDGKTARTDTAGPKPSNNGTAK